MGGSVRVFKLDGCICRKMMCPIKMPWLIFMFHRKFYGHKSGPKFCGAQTHISILVD